MDEIKMVVDGLVEGGHPQDLKDFENLTVEIYLNKNRPELYATQSLELNPYATKSVKNLQQTNFHKFFTHNFYNSFLSHNLTEIYGILS